MREGRKYCTIFSQKEKSNTLHSFMAFPKMTYYLDDPSKILKDYVQNYEFSGSFGFTLSKTHQLYDSQGENYYFIAAFKSLIFLMDLRSDVWSMFEKCAPLHVVMETTKSHCV